MTNQSFTYGTAQNLKANTFERVGYTFAGWNTAANGSGTNYADKASITTLTLTSSPVSLYAKWSPRTDTAYVVYHYTKNIGTNTYTLSDTQNLTGTTASSITLANKAKSITGFTYDKGSLSGDTSGPGTAATTTTIAANGSTKIYLYYSRNTHTITLNKDTGINSVDGAGTYEYDQDVTITATPKA